MVHGHAIFCAVMVVSVEMSARRDRSRGQAREGIKGGLEARPPIS